MSDHAAIGASLAGAPVAAGGAQHRLKGRCPDGDRCVNTQTPCSQLCLRLQPASIAEELQRHARADRPQPKKKLDPVRVDDLFDLRDVVHSRSADGHPVVVPDPGTDHGRTRSRRSAPRSKRRTVRWKPPKQRQRRTTASSRTARTRPGRR